MNETQITDLLNQLSEVRAQLDLINADRAAAQNAVMTPEIRQALADIEAEFEPLVAEAGSKAAALESQIKAAVVEHGATIKTDRVQAVYAKGRVSWDTKAIDGYAINHPELFAFRNEGSPSVSIRWR